MTYKNIETSREIRQWISLGLSVVSGAVVLAVVVMPQRTMDLLEKMNNKFDRKTE